MLEGIDIDQIDRDLTNIAELIQHRKKIEHYYDLAETENISLMSYGGYAIKFDMNIDGRIIKCILDTGCQVNCISDEVIDRLNLHEYVDTSIIGNAKGVGGIVKTSGFIPYLPVRVGEYILPSCFVVTNMGCDCECLVGILFMRFYNILIDFANNSITISGHPFPFSLG